MISLTVDGLSCAGCVRSVEKAVAQVDPAAWVRVDLGNGHVDIESLSSVIDLVTAIESAGYDVRT